MYLLFQLWVKSLAIVLCLGPHRATVNQSASEAGGRLLYLQDRIHFLALLEFMAACFFTASKRICDLEEDPSLLSKVPPDQLKSLSCPFWLTQSLNYTTKFLHLCPYSSSITGVSCIHYIYITCHTQGITQCLHIKEASAFVEFYIS